MTYKTWLSGLAWITWLCCTFIGALWLSWLALVRADFAYPLWYELLAIDQTIEVFGPQNRNRIGFERTDKAEHQRLFVAMLEAIHSQGAGLKELSYHDPIGRRIDALLTPAEIVHLRDVAALVDSGRRVGWWALAIWFIATTWLIIQKYPPPGLKKCAFLMLSTALCLCVLVLLVGPVRVFYRLHEWVFPSGHQWFFYYQDSLMTTLLKAPDIFAPIALTWLVISLLLALVMIEASRYLVRKRLAGK